VTRIFLNFSDSFVQAVAIGEEGLVPNFFELKVSVHEIIDGCFFDLVKFN